MKGPLIPSKKRKSNRMPKSISMITNHEIQRVSKPQNEYYGEIVLVKSPMNQKIEEEQEEDKDKKVNKKSNQLKKLTIPVSPFLHTNS